MQKLSKRLQAVADYITPGNRVADIGTDHAYIPIALLQRELVPSALAMDVKNGPLERAREHIHAAGLEEKIEIRLSDGLHQLHSGEADTIVIAGMGGMLTIRILEEALSKLDRIQEMVLEPQSDIAKVRAFLREQQFLIDKENLVLEEGKFYPVLHVVHNTKENRKMEERMFRELMNISKDSETNRMLADQYGLCLIYEKSPVLRQLLERDIRQKENILQSLQEKIPQQFQRAEEVQQTIYAIRNLYVWLYGNVCQDGNDILV